MRLNLLVLMIMATLAGCMGSGRAPVISGTEPREKAVSKKPVKERIIPGADKPLTLSAPDRYRVVRGDTLYSIAWRYQLDYKQVARWNRIRAPYVIRVGQTLRLTAPPVIKRPDPVVAKAPKPKAKPIKPKVSKKSVKKPVVKADPVKAKAVPKPKSVAKLKWQWPTRGKQTAKASSRNQHGLEIKGKMGQTIKAASGGDVVYSGSGLVGYGNLIIIKHSQSFLSAYAHNSRLLVAEGAKVSAGQPIAEMGNSGTNSVKLYFEIRKDGKTVNPRKYLP